MSASRASSSLALSRARGSSPLAQRRTVLRMRTRCLLPLLRLDFGLGLSLSSGLAACARVLPRLRHFRRPVRCLPTSAPQTLCFMHGNIAPTSPQPHCLLLAPWGPVRLGWLLAFGLDCENTSCSAGSLPVLRRIAAQGRALRRKMAAPAAPAAPEALRRGGRALRFTAGAPAGRLLCPSVPGQAK